MPKWMKKTLVVLITVFTFGLVTPPSSLSIHEQNTNGSEKSDFVHSSPNSITSEIVDYQDIEENQDDVEDFDFIKHTMEQVEIVSFEKFGQKIGPMIEDEFKGVILPKIEEVIKNFSTEYDDENLKYFAVSENPSGGIGERIFNIYDTTSGKDLIRFHVRRDKLPLEGYWFNFHYHTHHDQFMNHYTLGNIYWDKNTPPKWLS